MTFLDFSCHFSTLDFQSGGLLCARWQIGMEVYRSWFCGRSSLAFFSLFYGAGCKPYEAVVIDRQYGLP